MPVPVCRSLCEHVRSDCGGVLWPPVLHCDLLPLPETGLCMHHPDIITDNILLQLPPAVLHREQNLTLSSEVSSPPSQVFLLVTAVVSSGGLLLSLLCLLLQEAGQQVRMLVASQAVLVTGILVAAVAPGEREGTVCHLVSMMVYTGQLSSLAWWTATTSSLLACSRQLGLHTQQGLIWGAVILSCLASFSAAGVQADTSTSICHMKEQLISVLIPAAILLVTGLFFLVVGLCSSKQEKCWLTMFVSYFYFFIFLGVFLTELWAWTHSPSSLLSYSKLSLQFLAVTLCPLLVITSYLVTCLKTEDKTLSDSELSTLQSGQTSGSNLYHDPRHNVLSTNTLNTNIST